MITEFAGKYGLEQVQSQPGKAEHLDTTGMEDVQNQISPISSKKTHPNPSLCLLQYLQVEAVLLELLLRPLVQLQGGAGRVRGAAGRGDHQGRGQDGRRCRSTGGAAGDRLHLRWGRQPLLLGSKPATGRKSRKNHPENEHWEPPAAAGTSLERGCSTGGQV